MRINIPDHPRDNPKLYEWHDWFAWFPVIVDDGSVFCWLETVERKGDIHVDYLHRPSFIYRAKSRVERREVDR